MVGFYRAMLGRNGGTFDQGQQIALHAFARYIAATRIRTGTNLVDLVQKHDAVLFDSFYRRTVHRFIVQQLVGFFANKQVVAF